MHDAELTRQVAGHFGEPLHPRRQGLQAGAEIRLGPWQRQLDGIAHVEPRAHAPLGAGERCRKARPVEQLEIQATIALVGELHDADQAVDLPMPRQQLPSPAIARRQFGHVLVIGAGEADTERLLVE